LARALHAAGLVELGQLQRLLAQANASGRPLGPLLTHRGQLSPGDLASVQSRLDAESAVAVSPGSTTPTPGSGVAPVSPAFTPPPGAGFGTSPQPTPAPPTSTSRQLGPGSLVGDYRVLDRLGAGGMGTVYRAEHVQTGALAALKVMKRGSLGPREERFRREGEAQARADSHLNVVRVRSAGQVGDLLYLAMDLCEGGDLEQLLAREGTLSPERTREIVAALADGLAHVHAQGVLHRDLKPANVLFDRDGVPKLVDFGLARVSEAQTLTKTGAILGTPAYMAPEQVKGDNRALDERVDVHALGLILFEALTGQRPFVGESSLGLLRAIVQDDAPLLRSLRPELPQDLERIVERALAKDPEHRFASASELASALRTGDAGPRPPRARRGLPTGLALLAGVTLPLAALAVAFWPASGSASPPSAMELRQRLSDLRRDLQLAPETTAGLSALPPLRARFDALEEWANPAELQPLATDLRLLEGLSAASSGDLVQARAAAELEGGHPRLRDALQGAVAALSTEADPKPAREALARAQRSGVVLAPLPSWRAAAELRLADELLSEGSWPEALGRVEQQLELERVPWALRRALAQRALTTARSTLSEIVQSLDKGTRPARAVTERLRYHLRFARRVDPAALLPDEDFERLRELATDPGRSVNAELELETAQQRPQSYELQVAILRRSNLIPPTPSARRTWARRYLHVAKRVARLAPPAEELAALEQLGDVLANSVRYDEGHELAERLAQRDDLPEHLRVKVHYWRANGFDIKRDWTRCVASAKAALALDPSFDLAWSRLARAHYRLKEWKAALEASERYLQLNRSPKPQYSNVFMEACRRIFHCSRDLAKPWAYARAREALELLLATYEDAEWAGWWARLAFVTLRARDHEAARAALERAVSEMAKNPPTKHLVEKAEAILPQLGPPEKGVRALRRLINELEQLRRRNGDFMLP